jgi:hypothetical protein
MAAFIEPVGFIVIPRDLLMMIKCSIDHRYKEE